MDASQSRAEYKFLLPRDLAHQVRSAIAVQIPADRNQVDGYHVQSDYFDSADRETYWQKRFGHPNRRRIRTRIYHVGTLGETPHGFVEIKHKLVDTTVKRRIPVPVEFLLERDPTTPLQLPEFIAPQLTTRAEELAWLELQTLLAQGFRHPVTRMSFHRLAYDAGSNGRLRVTFDHDLTFAPLDSPVSAGSPEPLFANGEWIMEVKTIGAVPYWFRQLVARHHLVPCGVSKYVRALDHTLVAPLALA